MPASMAAADEPANFGEVRAGHYEGRLHLQLFRFVKHAVLHCKMPAKMRFQAETLTSKRVIIQIIFVFHNVTII